MLALLCSPTSFIPGAQLSRFAEPPLLLRHASPLAREVTFVGSLEVFSEPFAVGPRPVGDWFAQEEALRILMSQAEASTRLDAGTGSASVQRWEVTTPIQFPGMVAKSVTVMDVSIDTVTPKLSITSGESVTVCEGGPPWAQSLLARIGDIATTTSSNVIELCESPNGNGLKTAVSKVDLSVKLSIPSLFLPPFIPAGPFEKAGSESLQKLLDKDVAPAIVKFRDAYCTWAKAE